MLDYIIKLWHFRGTFNLYLPAELPKVAFQCGVYGCLRKELTDQKGIFLSLSAENTVSPRNGKKGAGDLLCVFEVFMQVLVLVFSQAKTYPGSIPPPLFFL